MKAKDVSSNILNSARSSLVHPEPHNVEILYIAYMASDMQNEGTTEP